MIYESKICEECGKKYTEYEWSKWCKACNGKHFQQNFKNWTSETQLSATDCEKVLEWIPYNKLYDIEYIAKGGFGKVYRAIWIDGFIKNWDNINKNWYRPYSNELVALKSLNNSENVTSEFINKVPNFLIYLWNYTRPETKNYMMVLQYADNGSLRAYLDKNYYELSWDTKIGSLWYITLGLQSIHEKELTHRDLGVTITCSVSYHSIITDMGLCKPADYNASENPKNSIYGVLPYIAPEVLRGQNYTKAADIYSFGIIMYEVISRLPPYHDVSHDKNLAIKICQGLRPRFSNIKKLYQWWIYDDELQEQIEEAEKINNSLPISSIPLTSLSYETHSEVIYTSRLLNFNNLPEPKNSDDYYNEQNDNIISEKFSVSLQIDISQLKINEI
ncbi:kinase-like domain-containing protein [Rhizophagus diaphanus]|nr:kinase-like domain-containing protein [Rhizophagus diaphanus] [Rhizophagus sp. MUCL 43196]